MNQHTHCSPESLAAFLNCPSITQSDSFPLSAVFILATEVVNAIYAIHSEADYTLSPNDTRGVEVTAQSQPDGQLLIQFLVQGQPPRLLTIEPTTWSTWAGCDGSSLLSIVEGANSSPDSKYWPKTSPSAIYLFDRGVDARFTLKHLAEARQLPAHMLQSFIATPDSLLVLYVDPNGVHLPKIIPATAAERALELVANIHGGFASTVEYPRLSCNLDDRTAAARLRAFWTRYTFCPDIDSPLH